LRRTLIEERIVVSLVILIFLFHVRRRWYPSSLCPSPSSARSSRCTTSASRSNIMSLGGLALAIAVVADASIVMVENAVPDCQEPEMPLSYEGQPRAIIGAAKQVPRESSSRWRSSSCRSSRCSCWKRKEGRMFRPLAFTKTSAMALASLLSITLVPVLMTLFIRDGV